MEDPAQAITGTVSDWRRELRLLEQQLVDAERLLVSLGQGDAAAHEEAVETYLAAPSWAPTRGIGRMPQELVGRAEALLTRQRELSARIAAALSAQGHQRGFADRVRSLTSTKPGPVYLDVQA